MKDSTYFRFFGRRLSEPKYAIYLDSEHDWWASVEEEIRRPSFLNVVDKISLLFQLIEK